MAVYQTPTNGRLKSAMSKEDLKENETPIRIPETPFLTRLGCGTGVSVYSMARSPKAGSPYRSPWAVKYVNRMDKSKQDASYLKKYELRINAEADILKRIRHPNIVGFRALAETKDGRKCLAMEECDECLWDLIEERCDGNDGPFSVNDIMRVALDIASALDYLHRTIRIIHGDIKSPNILIKDDFKAVKLCDFGVCLPIGADGVLDTMATGYDGMSYIGTPCWTAPEVLEWVNGPVTNKADIFAYGLVLWEMMALQAPHLGMDIDEDSDASFDEGSFNKRLGTRPPLPVLPKEYKPIIDIFNACTEHDLEKRPNADEIIKMLLKNNAV